MKHPKPEPPTYEPWYIPGGALHQCMRCGAVVGSTSLHTEYHLSLAGAIYDILDNVLPLLIAVAGEPDE